MVNYYSFTILYVFLNTLCCDCYYFKNVLYLRCSNVK